jgi:hypothetical protein
MGIMEKPTSGPVTQGEVISETPAVEVKKRHRRTKAEMETARLTEAANNAATPPVAKRIGRPKGSKNKPKGLVDALKVKIPEQDNVSCADKPVVQEEVLEKQAENDVPVDEIEEEEIETEIDG